MNARILLLSGLIFSLAFSGLGQSNSPVILQEPQDAVVQEFQSATFSCVATGAPPLFYQWYRSGSFVPGATNASFSVFGVSRTNSGERYSVMISNPLGTTNSRQALLTVLFSNAPPSPPVIVQQPQDMTVQEFQNAAFSVVATGAMPIAYQWYRSGGFIPGATNSFYTVSAPTRQQSGEFYSVFVSNASGGTNSRNAFLTVIPADGGPPFMAVSAQASCQEQKVVVGFNRPLDPATATNASNYFIFGQTNPVPIFAAALAPSNTVWLFTGPLQEGVQYMMFIGNVRDTNGNQLTNGTTLQFQCAPSPPLITGQPADVAASVGGTASLTVLARGTPPLFYIWRQNGSNLFTGTNNTLTLSNVQPAQAGNYDVIVMNGYGSATSMVARLLIGTPPLLLGARGEDNLLEVTLTFSTNLDAAAAHGVSNYAVTGLEGSLDVFDAFVVGDGNQVLLVTDLQIPGGFYQVTVNHLTDLTGYPLPPDSQAYFFAAYLDDTRVIDQPTNQPPSLPPVIISQPVDAVVPVGAAATFVVGALGSEPLSYQWYLNGSPRPGAGESILQIPAAQLPDSGPYVVVITNAYGAVTSAVASLVLRQYDFGDAPSDYPTLLVDDGARHVIVPGMYLGLRVDPELDGQPDSAALGDDASGTSDEDGVQFLTPLIPGQMATISVLASTVGQLDAWVDFQADGSWAQTGDQIFTNRSLLPGTNLLQFLVPTDAASAAYTVARFRFSSVGGLSFTGEALDGEVEDYLIAMNQGPPRPLVLAHKWKNKTCDLDIQFAPNGGQPNPNVAPVKPLPFPIGHPEPDPSPGDNMFTFADAVIRAAEAWNDANTGWTFHFNVGGINPVITVKLDVFGPGIPPHKGAGADLLAFFRAGIPDQNGEINSGEIVFNVRPGLDWGIGQNKNRQGGTDFDPILIALHELGHAIRLDHPAIGGTITAASSANDTIMRPLVDAEVHEFNPNKNFNRYPHQVDIAEAKQTCGGQAMGLRIRPDNSGHVRVAWPADHPAALQETRRLDDQATVWTTIGGTPQQQGDEFVVFLPIGFAAQFFRLIEQQAQISLPMPKADGTNILTVPADQSVNFTVTSTQTNCPKLEYSWDFGDGKTGIEQNSKHTFLTGGVYRVKVVISCGDEANTRTTGEVQVTVIKADFNIKAAKATDAAETLVPDSKEETDGLLLKANDNDDDEDGKKDNSDDMITGTETQKAKDRQDMATLTLEALQPNTLTNGKVYIKKLSGPGNVRIFKTNNTLVLTTAGATSSTTDAQADALFQILKGNSETYLVEGVDIGELVLALEYKDGSITAQDKIKITVLRIDLDVDTDRDGVVDDDKDEKGKDAWTKDRGAYFSVNCDRDGARMSGVYPIADAIDFDDATGEPESEDFVIENAEDEKDITPMYIRKILPEIPASLKVFLRTPQLQDVQRVHIYKKIEATDAARTANKAIWGRATAPLESKKEIEITQWVNPASPDFQGNTNGDAVFGIEGLFFKYDGAKAPAFLKFDGELDFVLELRQGAKVLFTNTVHLKVAPWMLISHEEASQRVFARVNGARGTIMVPPKSGPPFGGIFVTNKSRILDAEWFEVRDGVHAAVRFEFEKAGGVTVPNRTVDISAATTEKDIRNAIVAAINDAKTAGVLDIDASADAGNVQFAFLQNTHVGGAGNLRMQQNAGGDLTLVGMAGGGEIKNGESFTISDGTMTKRFEFKVGGAPDPTKINITAVTKASEIRDLMITSINAAGLNIQASKGEEAPFYYWVNLLNTDPAIGAGGEVAVVETVADPAFEVSGMAIADQNYKFLDRPDPGFVGLDDSGQLEKVTGFDAGSQWFQDHIQIGYTERPKGPRTHVVFRMPYGNNPAWPLRKLLGQDVGVFQIGGNLKGPKSSGDFGGNLELLPPSTTHKLGRITMGTSASPALQQFLSSQAVQAPVFNVPINWLAVAHIDEVISYLPGKKVAIADPQTAWNLLTGLPAAERANGLFFADGAKPQGGDVAAATATRLYDGPAVGQIITVSEDKLVDKETFTIRDGAVTKVFEIELGGGVTAPNVAIDLSAAGISTADQVRNTIITTINTAGFGVKAIEDGPATIHLWNETKGVAGNQAIDETVANAGFKVTNMQGGKAGGRDFTAVNWTFVRVYRTGAPEVGLVSRVKSKHDGWIDIDRTWPTTSKIIDGALAGRDFYYWTHTALATTNTWGANSLQAGDHYVLAEKSQFWASGTPAIVSVAEVLADTDFQNLNLMDAQNVLQSTAGVGGNVRSAIEAAAPAGSLTFIRLPVLFFGQRTDFLTENHSEAFQPGCANMQLVNGKIYVARQFSPRDAADKDLFQEDIKTKLGATVRFVDDWDSYHRLMGEVHCGSEVKRVLPSFDWWTNQP